MPLVRLLALAAITLAAACGGDSTGSTTPPPPPPPPPPPQGHSTTITVSNNSFSPTPDTIPVGNIRFHWSAGAITHNVTWLTGPSSPPGSGNRADGDADFVTALIAGDYTYHCTFHSGMNGAIHVNP
ncbi:MAG TPA: hypothetical protein VGJ80_01990 [Gemmatimonadales bacterium]|jgi:plastocyanin